MKIRDTITRLLAGKPQTLVIVPILLVVAILAVLIVLFNPNRKPHLEQPTTATSPAKSDKDLGTPPTKKPNTSPEDTYKFSNPASDKAPGS